MHFELTEMPFIVLFTVAKAYVVRVFGDWARMLVIGPWLSDPSTVYGTIDGSFSECQYESTDLTDLSDLPSVAQVLDEATL